MGLCATRKNSQLLKGLGRNFEKAYTSFLHLIINLSTKCEVNVVSKTGEGVIMSCRRGPKTQKPKEYILRFPGIESVSEAAHLIGRKVADT